jgi:hypothetical protein
MTTRPLSIDAIVQDPQVRGGRPVIVLVVSGGPARLPPGQLLVRRAS